MLNLCWFKHKKTFKCFRCFWKVFCFYKNWKISKIVLPCFGDLVVGHPSRMLQLELVGWFWRLVREWKVQSRGIHKDFCGSARDSLTSETSSCEKHLEIFFQIFRLEVFWWVTLATGWRLVSVAKIACFAKMRQFFLKKQNPIQFSLNLLWLFIVFFVWTSLKDTVFTHKLSLISLSLFTSLQDKVWILFPS